MSKIISVIVIDVSLLGCILPSFFAIPVENYQRGMKMIKFNQIVRASVLSLTLAGGLGLASHAFAYDQADIDDATNEYYERLEIVSYDQSLVDQNQSDYDSTMYYCNNFVNDDSRAWCYEDAWEAWYWEDQDLRATLADDQYLLNNAQSWLYTVTNDQNGMHLTP